MRRNIFLVLFLIAVIAAGTALQGRYRVERSNPGVELIMDYASLLNLEEEAEVELLPGLREKGLTAVAVFPDTLKDLINQGKARLIAGNEIARSLDKTGRIDPAIAAFPFEDNSVFIKIREGKVIKRAAEYLPRWAEDHTLEYTEVEDGLLVFFQKWDAKFLHLSLGFDSQLIDYIQGLGLKVVPRINNNEMEYELNLAALEELSPEYVIFSGNQVTGYSPDPGEGRLEQTAELMRREGIQFGMIEDYIARQHGAVTLARELDYSMQRVHSIQQGEMDSSREQYSLQNIIDRYLRGVRERNIRLLYLKPFLREKDGEKPVELTGDFISRLSSRLKGEGYLLGQSRPYPDYSSSLPGLLLLSLGIIIAGIRLLEHLLGFTLKRSSWVILVIALLVELALLYSGRTVLARKVLALGSSIIFPSLAVISQLLVERGRSWLLRFLKASLISLLGGAFLAASLAETSFILKVEQFSGVKLSFILPLLIISFYFLKNMGERGRLKELGCWKGQIGELLDRNLKVKHLLLLGVIAAGGYIYIGRTGNYPVLPVPQLERYFRVFLERVLYVRPRFKEFMLGHPAMILALGLKLQYRSLLLFYPLLLLAAVGQINILNTFSHIHTPLLVSLLRVFHGLWLGLIIGAVLLLIIRKLLSLREKGSE